jgi:GH25 family lysozyme M1 (1,4-beta-N-acetylmuramidase)
MSKKMLDVSANNHTNGSVLPWIALHKAGYQAVMIKATEGDNYVNPFLEVDVKGATEAGFEIGYYHFGQPSGSNGQPEVNHFWQTVKNLPRQIGCALDLEVTNGLPWQTLAKYVNSFLADIPSEVVNKVHYTNPDFLDHLNQWLDPHPLWLASWGKQPRQHVWAWQMGQAAVAGMPSPVDVGVLYA